MLLVKQDGDQVFPSTKTLIILPILSLLQSAPLTGAGSLDTDDPWSVRLNHNTGRSVEVSNSFTWHPLLVRDPSTRPVSSVVCRQLGMGPPLIQRGAAYATSPNDVTVSCNGSEPTLDFCHKLVATVDVVYKLYISECLPLFPSVEEYDIVLSRSDYSSSDGIPLVYYHSRWHPICEYSSLRDAACHQLELGDQLYQEVYSWNDFPYVSELPHFACDWDDDSLSECTMDICRSTGSYLGISCQPSPDDDDLGFSYSSSLWFVGVGILLLFVFGLNSMKQRALQNRNNARRTRSLFRSAPVMTSHQNSESTTDYQRRQGPQESMIPDDDPPSYPSVSDAAYPPPLTDAAYPPPAPDPDLPSYEQAVGQRRLEQTLVTTGQVPHGY